MHEQAAELAAEAKLKFQAMSIEEIIIYEYLVARRGIYHSVREVSKALDRKRAEAELRWAHFALKKLLARGKIERSVEGYYFVPHIEVEEGGARSGGGWRGGAMPPPAPLMAGMDTPGLAETETMFLEKSAMEKARAKPLSDVKPALDPVVELPREEEPSETSPGQAGDAVPHAKPNPSANIAFGRKLKGLPRPGNAPPGK
ncbi:MAG: hypothetical protein HZA89_14020 [Verrucomicrobia bacterium]|nr:hypothetical protein [Verrucomicrobiota bacterium]